MTASGTLGVVGTLVRDRLIGRDARTLTVEEWGGISYALAALSVALPDGWIARPILKVGADLAEEGLALLAGIPRLDLSALEVVPEANNRVEIRYETEDRRSERLSGGVPPWSWPDLAPKLAGCDALYVNFISGYEMDLDTSRSLSDGYGGPTWADLHSLFLGRDADGLRVPRALGRSEEWLSCWDAVQVNEDERALLGAEVEDRWSRGAAAVGSRPRLIAVTRGARGAAYATTSGFRPDPLAWAAGRAEAGGIARRGTVREGVEPRVGDPTGCGDVWGATCFARLLAGEGLEEAMAAANRLAGLSVEHRGASRLHEELRRAGGVHAGVSTDVGP